MRKQTIKNTYDAVIILLAIVSIVLVILQFMNKINLDVEPYISIDDAIWIIFTVDYFGGLFLAKKKWKYVKTHLFDLLAIIPFGFGLSFFKISRVTRLTRVFRIFRVAGVLGKFKERIEKFLKTNGFIYLLIICIIIILLAAGLYSIVENTSLTNSIWWAITTTTTVGYGDISPKTKIGKGIAIILMLVGVSFVGMLTSTLTTFFSKDSNQEAISEADEIRKFKGLMDDHIITKEEFEEKKKELLKNK
ncbi:potassium channel family protein [Fructilactobacillus fructivorans]|nr:potassium channel family protein [Fructilactobacillus fructivorans]